MIQSGLQVWDGSGQLLIDATTRKPRFLGIIYAEAAGSITVPEFATGIPFARPLSGAAARLGLPQIDGTTLSWPYAQAFFYGVY